MKKAVIFGAGNIGRGFIAPLFSLGGYEVTFIDVAAPLVERINKDRVYPLRIVSNEGSEDVRIENIRAVNGNDRTAAIRAIADADITATCVGAKAIKYILPNFAGGVKLRHAEHKGPLDLLICENLMDADQYVRDLLKDQLTEEELADVGLVETSVGRMVPVPKPETTADNPLRICVERYGVLPVDRDAFKGEIPEIPSIVPFSPFHYYIERKLYVHNMGHAICAYLGKYLGKEFIYESIAIPEVRLIVRAAMIESAGALASKYHVSLEPLLQHSADLIRRFGNRELGDTCDRVGADIPRKLAISDRLTGATLNILSEKQLPVYVCIGTAAALWNYLHTNETNVDAQQTLLSLSGLEDGHPSVATVMSFYELLENGSPLADLIGQADRLISANAGMIV